MIMRLVGDAWMVTESAQMAFEALKKLTQEERKRVIHIQALVKH